MAGSLTEAGLPELICLKNSLMLSQSDVLAIIKVWGFVPKAITDIKILPGGRQHSAFLVVLPDNTKLVLKKLNFNTYLGQRQASDFDLTEGFADGVSLTKGRFLTKLL